MPVASTYVSERVAAHERGRVVVLLESFWAVGWILAALIAYFVIPRFAQDMGWRVALALGHLIRTQYPGDSLRCVLFLIGFVGGLWLGNGGKSL